MVKTLTPRKILDTDSQLLGALEKGSETLQNITDHFAPLMKHFHIFFFWEQQKTDMGYTKDYVLLSTCHDSFIRLVGPLPIDPTDIGTGGGRKFGSTDTGQHRTLGDPGFPF